jgi:hypothetical protein
MRLCHWIKPNHKSETPHRAMWLSIDFKVHSSSDADKEYDFHAASVILGYKDSDTKKWITKNYNIETVAQIWSLIEQFTKTKTRTYLICNNSAWTLTVMEMFQTGPKLGWKPTKLVLSCPPCIVQLRKSCKTVTVIDISNIWPQLWLDTSIGPIGECSNEKTPKPKPSNAQRPSVSAVETMFRMMTEWWTFLQKNDLGGFSPTIGSQSVRVWRHRFMTHKVLIDCHDDALALAREAIYGGRNECFRLGRFSGDFTMLDTNGSYLSTCATLEVPTKLVGFTHNASVSDIQEWDTHGVVLAEVCVQTDASIYPCRRNSRTVYPVGTFETVLTGRELHLALKNGHVLSVRRAAVYEKDLAFREFSQAVWRARLDCRQREDMANEQKWKLIGASFWGKWAQKGGYWENVGRTSDLTIKHWTDYDYDTNIATQYRQIGCVVQKRNQEQESGESSPAIAACITSAARVKLHEFIREAGRDNTYYVDTDSLLVNAVGYWRLQHHIAPDQLGKLHVCWNAKTVQVYAKKTYTRDGIHVFAGVRQDAYDVDTGCYVQDERLGFETQVHCSVAPRAATRTRRVTADRGA